MGMDGVPRRGPTARAATALLLAYVISLAFMQPPIPIAGYQAAPADLTFLALAPVWGWALARGEAKLVWDGAWWPLIFYLAAMAISVVAAGVPVRGAIKLLTQVYLLSLPVIAVSLIRDEAELRRVFRWWIAASALLAAMAVLAFLLFYADQDNPLLARALYASVPLRRAIIRDSS
jgi:hypothetical protein